MRRDVEDGLSLLAGAAIGAAAMYLLDPHSGADRRQAIAQRTRDTLESAGEKIAPLVESAGESVSNLGGRVRDYASEWTHAAGDTLSEGSHDLGRRAGKWAESWRPHFGEPRRAGSIAPLPGAVGGLGLLALGAAAVYLFDAGQGRRRRAEIGNRFRSSMHDTGDFLWRAGRRITDRMRGTYHQTRARWEDEPVNDQQLIQRVRARLGHVMPSLRQIDVRASGGFVTLCGPLAEHERDTILNEVRSIPGVRQVHHEAGSTAPSVTDSAQRPS